MAAIITVCREDVGLPVVDPLYIVLHKKEDTTFFIFKTHPANVAALADAKKIHVNLEKIRGTPWGELLPLLAHEYGHNVEYGLAGGKLRGTTWFSEGFAEWVAAKVLDALGWQTYETTLRRVNLELARHRALVAELSNLPDGRDWISVVKKPKGGIPTYILAFAAVDKLIKKKGIASAIDYIKSGNFESSFGESQAELKTDLGNFGWETKPGATNKVAIRKPDWKVGYRWIYEERVPGKIVTLATKIIKEDYSIAGIPVFIVKAGDGEELYSRETLGLVATKNNGRFKTNREPPNEFFAWPLEAAKEWRNTYTLQNLETRKKDVVDRLMVVADMEEVTVPAGTFKAAKIEAYDNKSGRLQAEYWYVPTAKWLVKYINYGGGDGFLREQQLVSFKVD